MFYSRPRPTPDRWRLFFLEVDRMKREASDTQLAGGDWRPSGEPLLARYPHLDQALSDRWWEDGKPREPYRLSITILSPGVQVNVTDNIGRRTSYTVAATIDQAFEMIDDMLSAGSLPWRPWGGKGRG